MSLGSEFATKEQIKAIADEYGLPMTDVELQEHLDLLNGTIVEYRQHLEPLPERKLPVKYPRTPGWRPAAAENPFNGWYWRCDIKGADDGPLKGKRIAVKDTVCVAGVPMMNGSKLLEGYVPDIDATLVTRILDAGGTIVGKAACEDFSFSAGGQTCSTGPVGNPYDATRNPGASSNGSAVVLATGQVDMAIGGDQGGSIRLPSCWSGVYGLKPTFGLVPYTGCAMIEATLDHMGPMANSTADVALLLGAIAGYDGGNDPRQQGRITAGHDTDYSKELDRGVKGLRIGVLKEGFDHGEFHGMLQSDPEVEDCVKAALDTLAKQGAIIEEVSIPEHVIALPMWKAIALEGSNAFMLNGYGVGSNWFGWYNSGLAEYMARGIKTRAQDMPHTVRSALLSGEFFRRHHNGRYYNRAQNQRHIVTDAYSKALSQYDLIACPTIVTTATKMGDRDAGPLDLISNTLGQIRNTVACDITGHPSMSIPCGMRGGLPVGLMLSGRHFGERTILAASAAFEAAGDWKSM